MILNQIDFIPGDLIQKSKYTILESMIFLKINIYNNLLFKHHSLTTKLNKITYANNNYHIKDFHPNTVL